MTTLLNHPLGGGPALTAASEIPDLHHFRGSFGSREIIPLYRDRQARLPNVVPGLLDLLSGTCKQKVTPEDFLSYVYGVLAQPSFTQRFRKELGTRELRLPLTKDAKLFAEVSAIGRRLLWLHTYAERLSGAGRPKGKVPPGQAKCTRAVSDKPDAYPSEYHYDPATRRLTVGSGVFEPVDPAVFEFDVSDMRVLEWWLGYRMRAGQGKRSSPLDAIRPHRWTAQFTTELLELLWVLEATAATYPEQGKLLERVCRGPLFPASELPAVPAGLRSAPGAQPGLFPDEDQADND